MIKKRSFSTTSSPPSHLPPLRKKRLLSSRRRVLWTIAIIGLAVLCLCSSGYYYFFTAGPLSQLVRNVGRDPNEPALSNPQTYNTIMGRSWNILLLGSDNDNKYTFPAVLTQVMMVVHIDTTNNSVNMVSIPRDSWVSVPVIGGMHKIDQAFFLGVTHNNNSFDAGVRAARLTVEKDYGITIDRYAWVGLSGFAKVIDTLGGVDIDVTHPVVDDSYPDDTGKGTNPNDPYAYKRLYLAPGPHHLSGAEALEYVRSRHADLVGDIGRTQRQQEVLTALKQKLNVGNVLNNLSQLIKDITGQVYTDLNQQEMAAFANYGRTLSSKGIQHVTLGPGNGKQNYGDYNNIYDPSAGSNQDVIVPNCNNIQPVINNIFGLGDVQSCNVTGT